MAAIDTAKQTWRESAIPLNQNAPTKVDFWDTEPNHIIFQNPTSNSMYVSESANVSQNYYEMEIPAGGKKLFTKAKGMKTIYIWHADNTLESVPIVSFVDSFNPSNIDKTTETVNTQNVTGTVDVATMPALPAGSSHIGSVGIDTLPEVEVKNDSGNPLAVTAASYQSYKVTNAGDTVVKNAAGKIAAIKSDGTTVAIVKDNANALWKTTGESQFSQPIGFTTNLTINLSQAGEVYVIYL